MNRPRYKKEKITFIEMTRSELIKKGYIIPEKVK